MGKKTIFILVVTCILLLAGCGNQGRTEKAAEVNPAAQGNDDQTEEPENGDSQAAEEAGIKQENTKPENTLEGQKDGTVTFNGMIIENTIDATAYIILVEPMGDEIPYDAVFFELPDGEEEWSLRIGATVIIVCKDDFTEPAPHFGTLVSITSAEEGKTASSLTAEQIEDAKQVALVYYEGTVFSVNSIEYLEGELPHGDREGYCNFTVNVSRDGIVQEPNRTISLQLDQDGWKVVNEGY